MTASTTRRLQDVYERLKQERDELRVQAHLFKADASDEWDDLEAKLREFERRVHESVDDARDAKEEIGNSLHKIGDEIAAAYKRLRTRDY